MLQVQAHGACTKNQAQQLRKTNQHLQASLQTLRQAASDGVEPHLLNQTMMSEEARLQTGLM